MFKASIEELQRGMKAAAQMDARLCDEEWLRCYRYTEDWGPGIDLAVYDNGSGDNIFLFFTQGGAVLKGFDHESPVSLHAREDGKIWPGMYEGLPQVFLDCVQDEGALPDEVTFCIWQTSSDPTWQQGPVVFSKGEDDGSEWMLESLPTTAKDYQEWAQEYYEMELELSDIQATFDGLS